MPRTAAKKNAASAAKRPAKRATSPLGALPEWNLADLYSGLDDPAIKRDLDRVDAECVAFEGAYKGKLAEMARASGPARRSPRRCGVMKRSTISWAGSVPMPGLVHAGDTVDPARTKFYGDVQERLTAASTHLLFFTLELNRIDDALLEAAMDDPALGHYRPWLEDVRRYKPYQLEDRVEQLFHEKSMTAYSAWNRLFDATIANLALQGAGKIARHRADAQSSAGPRGGKAQGGRTGAGAHVQRKCATVRAGHQHARQGQGNLRPLARLCRRCRRAPSGQSGRARSGRCAGRGGARRLSASVAPLLRA